MNCAFDPLATRRQILNSAEKRFLCDGYAGTSLTQIAKEAAVSKGLIIHHFCSKEQLWEAVAQLHVDKTCEVLDKLCSNTPEEPADIQQFIRDYHAHLADNQDHVRFILLIRSGTTPSYNTIPDQITKILTPWIENGQKRQLIRNDCPAQHVWLTMMSLIHASFCFEHNLSKHFFESILSITLSGIS